MNIHKQTIYHTYYYTINIWYKVIYKYHIKYTLYKKSLFGIFWSGIVKILIKKAVNPEGVNGQKDSKKNGNKLERIYKKITLSEQVLYVPFPDQEIQFQV